VELPAVAAVATISAASAAATPPAVPAASTTIPAATATTAAAGTFGLRPGFVHDEITPAEVLAVQRIHCAIRILVIGYFDERETPGLSCETVTN
jgi:hypothetical protein